MPPRETPADVLRYMQRVQMLAGLFAGIACALLASRLGLLTALALTLLVATTVGLVGRWLILRRFLRTQQRSDVSSGDPREGSVSFSAQRPATSAGVAVADAGGQRAEQGPVQEGPSRRG